MKNLRKVPTTTQGQKQDGGDSDSMDMTSILNRKVAVYMKSSNSESERSDCKDDDEDKWKQDEQNPAVVPVISTTVPQESQNNPLPEKVQSQQSNALGTTNLASGYAIKKKGIRLTKKEKDDLSKRRKTMGYSDDESDSDNELSDDKDISQNSPSGREERSESPDSGYGDNAGSRAISPVHPEQKTEESPVLPDSRVDSPSAVQVNNVNPVDNKVQDPSTSSFKGHAKFFASKGGVPHPS
ncbi:MAG: hypothetical protein ABS808_02430 [Wolbachia endosymbiont of Polyergus mexicanus]|uniref:Uncharacterized protein n=1 Tax=Wolbachia endosymbiont of Polyergus mexicanus TaxID=3171167 RepID=A0AAU7YL80_9RICK